VRTAIHHALALDAELLALLVNRREHARGELAQAVEGRAALQSYRGAGPSSGVYIERLT
jgi:hypothetical protein